MSRGHGATQRMILEHLAQTEAGCTVVELARRRAGVVDVDVGLGLIESVRGALRQLAAEGLVEEVRRTRTAAEPRRRGQPVLVRAWRLTDERCRSNQAVNQPETA